MLKILKVNGKSMSPLYKDGDFLLVLKFFSDRQIKPGKNIIFKHSKYGRLIKKVISVNRELKTFRSVGLNLESITTEQIGIINFTQIEGFPLYCVKKNKLQ